MVLRIVQMGEETKHYVAGVLAFGLLACQLLIPWFVPHFVTEDGPSHLYTAAVARNLVFVHHADYLSAYSLNSRVVPNWGTTIIVGLLELIVGPDRAETALMDVAILIGFFSLAYALRAMVPHAPPWTPIANFLLQTWFLWLGFYNFYLGMVLVPLLVGYYIRHHSEFSARNCVWLSVGLLGLFFTHLVPALFAMFVIALISVWMTLVSFPARDSPPAFPEVTRRLFPVGLAGLPVLLLTLFFTRGAHEPVVLGASALEAAAQFPMHVFVTASGRYGNQVLLVPAFLCLIVLAIAGLRRGEWRSIYGAVAFSTVSTFLVYLFVPDSGFGGKEAKIRFVWGIFLLGGLLVAAAPGLRTLRAPFEIYLSVLLSVNIVATATSVVHYSHAVEAYLHATEQIPRGAHFIRVGFPIPDVSKYYDFEGIARDPLFHMDAYVATRCRCVDLTDFQASNGIFPVTFAHGVSGDEAATLWSFEVAGRDAAQRLKWLEDSSSVAINYVILVGDASSPPGYSEVSSQLNSQMRLVGTSEAPVFVQVFERTPNNSKPISSIANEPRRIDDSSSEVYYAGEWFHDRQFSEATGGTVTYSDHAGDLFRLVFKGTSVTYVYTKARNRGLADILIDGRKVRRLDLYSAETRWQESRIFGGLAIGEHSIEVRVVGLKNPKSHGTFVDVDQLVIAP